MQARALSMTEAVDGGARQASLLGVTQEALRPEDVWLRTEVLLGAGAEVQKRHQSGALRNGVSSDRDVLHRHAHPDRHSGPEAHRLL